MNPNGNLPMDASNHCKASMAGKSRFRTIRSLGIIFVFPMHGRSFNANFQLTEAQPGVMACYGVGSRIPYQP